MRTSRSRARSDGSGFTLVEVVVATAVFGLLVALLLPGAISIRRRIHRSRTRQVEVMRVHQEVQRFLLTGEVSKDAVAVREPNAVEIKLADPEAAFTIRMPR